jgi:hypothetical protein
MGTYVAIKFRMHSRTTFYGLLISIFLFPITLHAEWITITSKTYQHIAVGKSIVLTNPHKEFLRLDFQGNVIERFLAPSSDPEIKVPRRRTDGKILDDLRFRDIDQDSQTARTLLENEQTLSERRKPLTGYTDDPTQRNHSFGMAMDGHQLWTASPAGVFQWVSKQPRQILHGPFHGHFSLASAKDRLLFAAGTRLIFYDEGKGILWDRSLAGEAHRVTLSASGRQAAWLLQDGMAWWHETRGGFEGTRSWEFSTVVDVAFCGESLLVLADSQVIVFLEDGTITNQILPQAAHHIVCTNELGAPWVLQGKDLLLSADGGGHWQVLPLPLFTRIRDMAATPSGALISSSEGLHYCPWGAWSTILPSPSVELGPEKHTKTRISWWQDHLPRVTVHSQFRQRMGRQDFRTLLLATFPLDRPTPFQVAVAPEQRDDHLGIPPMTESPTPYDTDGTPRELPCLHRTRRRAVETFLVEPERARSYLRRSAHAAWLPELRVMVDRRFGRSESLDYVASPATLSSPLGVDTVNDVRYEARATWDLARLVFSSEELAAQSQAIRMAEQRRDIEMNIHRLFFERQRLRHERVTDPTQVSRRSLRLHEITAELDTISANAFSECLAQLEKGAK